MAIQQIMVAQRISAGGGTGLPPNGIGAGANLTFWYDGDSALQYQTETNLSPITADGQTLARSDSGNSIARIFTGGYQYKAPVSGSANGFRRRPADPQGLFYTRPASGASPTTQTPMSTLWTVSNAVMVICIKVDNARPVNSPAYNNSGLIYDQSQYIGLHMYQTGSLCGFAAYNYSGGAQDVSVTEALSTWVVITMKHSGGQLRIRKNGGAWTSVASGNTDTLGASALFMMQFGDTVSDVSVSQIATYNAAITDANLLQVERWMGAKVGVVI